MQVDSPSKIRNLAVLGHNDTGKTTLVSSALYTSGVVNRLGRVEDGNTVTDFDAEEVERGISIGMATCFLPWRQHKVNIVDCPGYGIFLTEIRAGMQAADAGLLCINAVAGVQVTTEKVWEFADEARLPLILHLTKMDRENADLERVLEGLQDRFGRNIIPIQLPIGQQEAFDGVIDLVHKKAFRFKRDGDGKATEGPVPDDLTETVETWHTQLVEAVAETDDALMEKFFEDGDLSNDDLITGLKVAIRTRALFPVTLGTGLHGVGTATLLDCVVDLLPSPLERAPYPATDIGGQPVELAVDANDSPAVLVFKTLNDPFSGKITLMRVISGELNSDSTVWNSQAEDAERLGHLLHLQGKQSTATPKLISGDIGGVAKLKLTKTGHTLTVKDHPIKLGWIDIPVPAISFAIEPKSKGDEEKIGEAINKLIEEDPALQAGRDPQTGEYLLSGTGQLHVEIAVAKLKKRFNVEVILHPPKVPYRETVLKSADGHGRHKKQTGGRGQFADCKIQLEPLPRGGDFEFLDQIFGGAIPQNYRPAVEKGIQEAATRGFLAGYPVVDFRIRLIDGQYHDVDSSELAFKIAGSLAFKDAMAKAHPTIIEPMMQVEIDTTEEFMGDIMSDLSQRRGRPQGMEARNTSQLVKAIVPMAEMLNYAPGLRAMTQGRASFTMEFSHYEEVPRPVQEKIIAEARRDDDGGED